jgi:hypothetical protein
MADRIFKTRLGLERKTVFLNEDDKRKLLEAWRSGGSALRYSGRHEVLENGSPSATFEDLATELYFSNGGYPAQDGDEGFLDVTADGDVMRTWVNLQ